jgi:hypothetical protein
LHQGKVEAVFVLQHAARIDRRGLRPLGDADPLALEVGRLLHRTVAPDVDRRVPGHARGKHRDADERRIPLGGQRGEFRHRDFRHVEIPVGDHPEEDLFDLKVERREIDAFDRDAAAHQLGDMVVVADRQRQRQLTHRFTLHARL